MSLLTNHNSQAMSMADREEDALNLVSFACSIFTPLFDMCSRPFYGTRYIPTASLAASCLLMILLPLLDALFHGLQNMIPFSQPTPVIGLFGFDALSKAFFAGVIIHACRLKKLMIHMHLEENSYYEGPGLPLFNLVPWFSRSFFTTRIVGEPLLVLIASVVLRDFYIIQPGVAIFMRVAAVALCIKAYISWYQSWLFLRGVFDGQRHGAILAKLVEGSAHRRN